VTREQIAVLLDRAETWPDEAQAELIRAAIEIEHRHLGTYKLSAEERADIEEGLAELARGEFASDEEVLDTFQRLRGA
jgi:hypothetical protein